MVGCRPATARKPAKLVCSLQWTCMCGRHNACYASQPMLVPKWDAHAKAKHVCARPGCAGRASVHPDSHGALLQGLRRMVDQANAGKHKPRPPIDPRPLRFGEGADGGEGSEPVERRTAVSCSVCGAGISKADNFSSHKHRACPSAEPLPAQLWRPRAGPPSRPWLRMPEPDARQQRIDQLIIVGNSTSGCVRATAVDAQQLGFAVCVPQDAVFDRIQLSHQGTLLDLWMKYALVAPADDELLCGGHPLLELLELACKGRWEG